MGPALQPLLANDTLRGRAWCEAHSALVDSWLRSLFEIALAGLSPRGLALVAVGGYGRSELAPQSDIDVMLVHDNRRDVASIADHLWYPIWDAGMHLGHSVTTRREVLKLAADDVDTATALLTGRLLAGDASVSSRLIADATTQWTSNGSRWLKALAGRVEERHATAGEIAFSQEPDLKDGRGGLRDVHTLYWASLAGATVLDIDWSRLERAYSVLLDARVELQRITRRHSNVLETSVDAAVAKALGDEDADGLRTRLASAARTIAWTSDLTWQQVAPRRKVGRNGRRANGRILPPGTAIDDDELLVVSSTAPGRDPVFSLRVAATAASTGSRIERRSLEQLTAISEPMPVPWPQEARRLLVELLLAGPSSIPVIESIDERGVWQGLFPEWPSIRAHRHRERSHRFTIDRHLLEAAAGVADLGGEVPGRALVAVACLVHELGVDAGTLAARVGFGPDDADEIGWLVANQHLLAETSTRRDLSHPATISRLAEAVGSHDRLMRLAAFTEADIRATAVGLWEDRVGGLAKLLVARVDHLLTGKDVETLDIEPFPTPLQWNWLRDGEQHIEVDGDVVHVVTYDLPGVFARIAGVLALHGLDVVSAAAFSTDSGRALSQFHVHDPVRQDTPWPRITGQIQRALDGRLAINARVAERAQLYARGAASERPRTATVSFDNEASPDATVIDVRTGNHIGVLYRITRAVAELDLDIRSATVSGAGDDVIDAFYVRDRRGRKVTDPDHLSEIERAILHSVAE